MPLLLREGNRRNVRSYKAYVSLFVCFATKSIHLELVSDLTSEAFIAAFKRFISRSGRPTHMYRITGPSWALIDKVKNTTYIMINSPRLKIFCASWKFHGASSRLMHFTLEVYGRQPQNLQNITLCPLGSWARLI